MRIGPKYKIARRLGAPVFEKTQTQKFALSQARKERSRKGRGRPKSNFGLQLLEKQKARFTYCMMEKQFSRTVKNIIAKKDPRAADRLFESLELRLDNVVYRAGLASTRLAARQMVSHGHVDVNGERLNIPSAKVSVGDIVSIRPRSKDKALFAGLEERLKNVNPPSWLVTDREKREVKVTALPQYRRDEQMFDVSAVLEFYSR